MGILGYSRGRHEPPSLSIYYSPGALFHYADNSFRMENKFHKQDPIGYADMVECKPLRWRMGLGLWSRTSEILTGIWEYGAGPIDVD